MARINLLPWREQRRQELKKEFFIMIALALVLGIAAAAGGFADLLITRRARLGSALQFPMVATLSASADNWSRFAAAVLSLLTAVSGIAAWLLSGIKS